MGHSSLFVTIPADPRYLRVVRMLVSGSAATAGLGYDRIDDVALAIDEAGSELLRLGGASSLDGVVSSDDDGIHVRLATDADGAVWPVAGWDDSLGAAVLRATTRAVVFDREDGRSIIRLSFDGARRDA